MLNLLCYISKCLLFCLLRLTCVDKNWTLYVFESIKLCGKILINCGKDLLDAIINQILNLASWIH